MKTIRIVLLILIIIGIILLCTQKMWVPWLVNKILVAENVSVTSQTAQSYKSYKDATYTVENQPVTLVNGTSEVSSAPGSSSKTITQYFGNSVVGDLNGDGLADVGFILTQNSGGSGTFYYSVVALKTADGYQGTHAVLLGDRIAPQTSEIKNGQLIVNYADRAPGQAMVVKPSVGVTKYLKISGTKLELVR